METELFNNVLINLRRYAIGIIYEDRIIVALEYDAKSGITEPCPFCGERHHHGVAPGYRSSHCSGRAPHGEAMVFNNILGQEFSSEDGYFLVSKGTIRQRPPAPSRDYYLEDFLHSAPSIMPVRDTRKPLSVEDHLRIAYSIAIIRHHSLQVYNKLANHYHVSDDLLKLLRKLWFFFNGGHDFLEILSELDIAYRQQFLEYVPEADITSCDSPYDSSLHRYEAIEKNGLISHELSDQPLQEFNIRI